MADLFKDKPVILAAYILLAICGQLCHILKKKIAGETASDIKTYLMGNMKSTVLSIFASIIAVLGADQAGMLNIMSAFIVGYMSDSVLNKDGGSDVSVHAN